MPESSDRPYLSLIIPVFNEADAVEPLFAEIRQAMTNIAGDYEVLFVDDGSTDETPQVLRRLADDNPPVRVLTLRGNQGQTAALTAGIDHARGVVLVPLDGDGQNDPADIPALVAKLEQGKYDLVSGWRRKRQDRTLTRVIPSRIANALIAWFCGVPLHDFGCSLKAYRREVIEGVRLYGEMHRFLAVYAAMEGGKVAEMEVNHRPRRSGASKYGLERVHKVALDLLLVKYLARYTAKPIYVFGGAGLVCMAASLLAAGAALAFKFAPAEAWQKDLVETPLPVMSGILFLVGMLALLQGLLAEMLMRTYFESQGKRPYRLHSSEVLDRPVGGEHRES